MNQAKVEFINNSKVCKGLIENEKKKIAVHKTTLTIT